MLQTELRNRRRKAVRQLSVLSTPVTVQHTYTGLSLNLEYVVTRFDGYLYSSLLLSCCTIFFLLNLFTSFLSSSSLFYIYFHFLLFLFTPMHYFILFHSDPLISRSLFIYCPSPSPRSCIIVSPRSLFLFLHQSPFSLPSHPEDGCSTLFQNVCSCLPK